MTISRSELDRLREEYQHALRSTYVDRGEPDVGRTYYLVDEDKADALIAALEAEVERANELDSVPQEAG